jgi:hypothetical protein
MNVHSMVWFIQVFLLSKLYCIIFWGVREYNSHCITCVTSLFIFVHSAKDLCGLGPRNGFGHTHSFFPSFFTFFIFSLFSPISLVVTKKWGLAPGPHKYFPSIPSFQINHVIYQIKLKRVIINYIESKEI